MRTAMVQIAAAVVAVVMVVLPVRPTAMAEVEQQQQRGVNFYLLGSVCGGVMSLLVIVVLNFNIVHLCL
jgi:hypothetical protein